MRGALGFILCGGRVLLLRRGDNAPNFPGFWGPPGGTIEGDESPLDTVVREVEEEAGVHIPAASWTFLRAGVPSGNFTLDVFIAVLDAEPEVRLSFEHTDRAWVPLAETASYLVGPATKLMLMEIKTMTWLWPLKGTSPLFPDEPGTFGSVRAHDVHTGVDLYCEMGQEVVAVEDGEVIHIEGFTGPNAADPSPWWNDTDAILVRGASGVVTYGEVKSRVQVGDTVVAGQVIAVVEKPVLRSFKGRPMVMLHLELMSPEATGTVWWKTDDEGNALPQPPTLLDPMAHLVVAAGEGAPTFDLTAYKGERFRDPEAAAKDSKWWAVWGGENKLKALVVREALKDPAMREKLAQAMTPRGVR